MLDSLNLTSLPLNPDVDVLIENGHLVLPKVDLVLALRKSAQGKTIG